MNSLDATQQRAANAEQAQQVARLEQQVTDGSTTAALARAAAGAGMVPAGTPGHLVLGPDGQSAVRGDAVPAPAPAPAPVPAAAPAPAAAAAPAPAPAPSAGN